MIGFRDYIDFAEKYLRIAERSHKNGEDVNWLLIPSIIISWSAVEAFVNNMLDDFANVPQKLFELHERAFLLEKRIKFLNRGLKKGMFELEGNEYKRLDEKIFFLIAKFGNTDKISKGDSLWQKFERFKSIRDNLVHPRRKEQTDISIDDVRDYVDTAKEIIQLLSKHVWDKTLAF
ncbi:MAG: hypothetical protein GF353_01425 [Candidatus Lokiarchaeota archaeon]|nr:hypothetical protein [Candidatus Lokiarchaeota archaeon]